MDSKSYALLIFPDGYATVGRFNLSHNVLIYSLAFMAGKFSFEQNIVLVKVFLELPTVNEVRTPAALAAFMFA